MSRHTAIFTHYMSRSPTKGDSLSILKYFKRLHPAATLITVVNRIQRMIQFNVRKVSEFEKRGNFAHLLLNHLYLWNHNSYELQTWHEYSSIILLHSLQIVSHAHFWYGRGERARLSCSKNAILWPSLAAHRSGQEACSSF
jgi:hypothetical protein